MSPAAIIRLVGTMTAIVTLGVSLSTTIWADYRMTTDAMESMHRSTVILANQTELAFQNVDLTMRHTINALLRQETPWSGFKEPASHIILAESAADLPQLQALVLANDRGKIVAHSRLVPPPDIMVDDRGYFKAHVEKVAGYDTGLFIDQSMTNKLNGNWMIPLSRRLDFDGAFVGVLMAAMDISYFSWIYSSMYVPEGGAIYTQRADGIVLVSYPTGVKVPSGPNYLSFSERVPEYNLVVGMSLSLETLREPWRVGLMIVFFGSLLTTCCIIAIVVYATVKVEKYEHWEDLRSKARWLPKVIHGGKDDET